MSRKIVVLLILLTFVFISTAFSQPKPLPTPGYVLQQNYPSPQINIPGQTYQPVQTKTPSQPPIEETTYEKRAENAYFFSGASSPIEIDKWTYPEAKSGYPVNNPIYVYVDIKSKSSYPIENIQIREETVPALKIINTYGYCTIDPIRECFNEINIDRLSSGQRLIGTINKNNLTINIMRLQPKEWIRYNYTLIPLKEGIYYVDTLVRICGNTSDFRDLFLPLKINIEPKLNEFNVIPRPDKYQAFQGEDVTIVYSIQYLGNNPNECKFLAILDSTRSDFNCASNNSKELKFNNVEKMQTFNPTVQFNQIGSQPIPGITIYDLNDSQFSSPIIIPLAGSLNIDTIYMRYKVQLDYIIQFVSILVSILIGMYGFGKKFEGSVEELKNSIKELKTSIKADDRQEKKNK